MSELIQTLGQIVADPSFWIGFIAVSLFCLARFNELQRDNEELDPPIPPRAFTTGFRYKLAALCYVVCYSFLYGSLIILGGFPFWQDILVRYIGAIKGESIGTPAWAAMAITSIIPFLGPFQRFDAALRTRLHDFASIPLTARRLAIDILSGTNDLTREPIRDSVDYAACYALLKSYITQLKASSRLQEQRGYVQFFGTYQFVQDNLDQLSCVTSIGTGDDIRSTNLSSNQWKVINKRLSRLIACAVLNVESDEFAVREILSRELKIPGVEPGKWRFTFSQLLLGVFIVIICVTIGMIGAGAYELNRMNDENANVTVHLLTLTITHSALIAVLTIPMFMLALAFAAGVQLYLLDRQYYGDPLEWHELMLARVLTFAGAYCLSFLPILAFAAITAREGVVEILRWLPWAIPPAAVTTLFVIQSLWKLSGSRWLNAGLDFVSHAAVTFSTTWIALSLSEAAGLASKSAPFGLPVEIFHSMAYVAAFVTGGTLGALQCGISRRMVGHRSSGPSPLLAGSDSSVTPPDRLPATG